MVYRMDKRDARRILSDPKVVAAARKEAEEIAARARASAPRDSGNYADSIVVDVEQRGGIKHDRPVAVVTATAPHSAAIEFGNSRSPARHTLRNAARPV